MGVQVALCCILRAAKEASDELVLRGERRRKKFGEIYVQEYHVR